LDLSVVGIAQLSHAAGESIFCLEWWRGSSSQRTLGRTLGIQIQSAVFPQSTYQTDSQTDQQMGDDRPVRIPTYALLYYSDAAKNKEKVTKLNKQYPLPILEYTGVHTYGVICCVCDCVCVCVSVTVSKRKTS